MRKIIEKNFSSILKFLFRIDFFLSSRVTQAMYIRVIELLHELSNPINVGKEIAGKMLKEAKDKELCFPYAETALLDDQCIF